MFKQYVGNFLLLAALSLSTPGVAAYAQTPPQDHTNLEATGTAGEITYSIEDRDGKPQRVDIKYHTEDHLKLSDRDVEELLALADQDADGFVEYYAYDGEEIVLPKELEGKLKLRVIRIPKEYKFQQQPKPLPKAAESDAPASKKPTFRGSYVEPTATDVGGGFFLGALNGVVQYSLWLHAADVAPDIALKHSLVLFGVVTTQQVMNKSFKRFFQSLGRNEYVARVCYDLLTWNATNFAMGSPNSVLQTSISALFNSAISSAFNKGRDNFLGVRYDHLTVAASLVTTLSLLYWKVNDQVGRAPVIKSILWDHYAIRTPLAVTAAFYMLATYAYLKYPKQSVEFLENVNDVFKKVLNPMGDLIKTYLAMPVINRARKIFGLSRTLCDRIYEKLKADDSNLPSDFGSSL
ncbi:MAG: hypothetical protein JST80_00500 [Bdellovibrionales bacterium]|nr:hypothetical protein [Bdellovibrionales bacterium]